jgi:6-phosphogluconolactonase
MKTLLYIGSYNIPSPWAGAPRAHGAGIICAELDAASASIALGQSVDETNPSFLVRHRQAGLLWAITEPESGGGVLCYRVESAGNLTRLGRLSTGSDAPCHIAIDWPHRLCFVSHYHGGAVAVVSLADTGGPAKRVALVTPPNIVRGEDRGTARPRPHASILLDGSELLVTDTGRDSVLLYGIVNAGSTSGINLVDVLPLPIGAGPRHLARHRASGLIYVSNQNVGGVSVIARVVNDGAPRLELRGIVASEGLGRDRCVPSEIAIHPIFDVVYMANRVDNSLSIFTIDSGSGDLFPSGCVDVMGRNPRHFAISSDGGYLIVANQDSDSLAVFKVSDGGRELTWTGKHFDVATPTAICF